MSEERKTVDVSVVILGEAEAFARKFETLSSREAQIAGKIANGETNRQIAAELDLDQRTVEKHRYNITRKLEARIDELVRGVALMQAFGFGSAAA